MIKQISGILAGFLLGSSVTFLSGIVYLRANLIHEIPVPGALETVSSSVLEAAKDVDGWRAEEMTCRLPDSPEGPVKNFRFCHLSHAKELLEGEGDRRISAVIPCSMSAYRKADGQVYMARLNMSLFSRLLGGTPAYLFSRRIVPEQETILRGISAKQVEKSKR